MKPRKRGRVAIQTGYPAAPMLNIQTSKPLENALEAVLKLATLEQSDAVKVEAMRTVVALAKDASITIEGCTFIGDNGAK